jgi:hypothetical protein
LACGLSRGMEHVLSANRIGECSDGSGVQCILPLGERAISWHLPASATFPEPEAHVFRFEMPIAIRTDIESIEEAAPVRLHLRIRRAIGYGVAPSSAEAPRPNRRSMPSRLSLAFHCYHQSQVAYFDGHAPCIASSFSLQRGNADSASTLQSTWRGRRSSGLRLAPPP